MFGKAIGFIENLGRYCLLLISSEKVEPVAATDDFDISIESSPGNDRREATPIDFALEGFALHHSCLRVGILLKIRHIL